MKRSEFISRMEDSSKKWDFIVVGGGATRLGPGLDTAARGYSVLLPEQLDFVVATSRRSTKMRHGVLTKKLKGGVTYHDGQFDDARLALTLARTMADLGGTMITMIIWMSMVAKPLKSRHWPLNIQSLIKRCTRNCKFLARNSLVHTARVDFHCN